VSEYKTVCGKIRDKVIERDSVVERQGDRTNVQGRNAFIESQSQLLLDALLILVGFYNALPVRIPELYGPAARDTLREVLAIEEPSDSDDEAEERDDAALIDLKLIKEVGNREDADPLVALERGGFGETVQKILAAARRRVGFMGGIGNVPIPAQENTPSQERREPTTRRRPDERGDLAAALRDAFKGQPRECTKYQAFPTFSGDDASTLTGFYHHCMKVEFVFEQNSVPEERRLYQGSQAWVEGSPAKAAYELYTMGQADVIGVNEAGSRTWRGACDYVRRTIYGSETDSLDKYARDFLRQAHWSGKEHPATFFKDFVRHVVLCKEELSASQARRYFVDALPQAYWSCVTPSVVTVQEAYEAVVERYHRIQRETRQNPNMPSEKVPPKAELVAPVRHEHHSVDEDAGHESDGGRGLKRGAQVESRRKSGKKFKHHDPIEHEVDERIAALVRQEVRSSMGRMRREQPQQWQRKPWQQQQQQQQSQQQQQQPQQSHYQRQPFGGGQDRERCCAKHRFVATPDTKCYACQGFGHYAGHCTKESSGPSGPSVATRTQGGPEAEGRHF
jgi:hypothetical protein